MESATETLITQKMELEDFWAHIQAEAGAIWLPFATQSAPIQMTAGERIIFPSQRVQKEGVKKQKRDTA